MAEMSTINKFTDNKQFKECSQRVRLPLEKIDKRLQQSVNCTSTRCMEMGYMAAVRCGQRLFECSHLKAIRAGKEALADWRKTLPGGAHGIAETNKYTGDCVSCPYHRQ